MFTNTISIFKNFNEGGSNQEKNTSSNKEFLAEISQVKYQNQMLQE